MHDSQNDFSQTFYPFLHENGKQPQDLMKELSFSLVVKACESVDVKQQFFRDNQEQILQAALALARAYHRGNKMLVCGNGGSATDAQHVAVEFMHPITVGRKALPAICLNNDMAMVTAVANDVSFDDVFVRVIIALGTEGDVLIGISTSGNSANLLHAFATAQRMGLTTIGFSGNDGGRMNQMRGERLLDFCLTVPTASVHRIQETHMTLYHIMWDMTHEFLQHPALLSEEIAANERGLTRIDQNITAESYPRESA